MSGHNNNTVFSLLVLCHPFSFSFAVFVSAHWNKQLKVVTVHLLVVVGVVGLVGMVGMAGAPGLLELVGLVVVCGMAVAMHMIGVVGCGW